MKKKASEVKPGQTITIAGEEFQVISIETSDIGKQGKRKCRIEAQKANGEKVIIIRPEDYPFTLE